MNKQIKQAILFFVFVIAVSFANRKTNPLPVITYQSRPMIDTANEKTPLITLQDVIDINIDLRKTYTVDQYENMAVVLNKLFVLAGKRKKEYDIKHK